MLQKRGDQHRGEGQCQAPAEEDQPDLVGVHVEREGGEGQQREEPEVVEQSGDSDTEQSAVPQCAQWVALAILFCCWDVLLFRDLCVVEQASDDVDGHPERVAVVVVQLRQ